MMRSLRGPRQLTSICALFLLMARPLSSQQITWRTVATLYGDNTEFFTPYRVGETILGGQLSSWFDGVLGPHASVDLGLFADRRAGSNQFVDSLKPILSFRYRTTHGLGVFGTLETVDRHGLLEPLMVTTREITTPIEYGAQWIEHTSNFHGEVWINWQKINQPDQREQFEVGNVYRFDPLRWVTLQAQQLWYHRGGQLFNPTPVTNNYAEGPGITVHDSIAHLGSAYVSAWELWSNGHIDPFYPAGRPDHGHGTYLRAGVSPHQWEIGRAHV